MLASIALHFRLQNVLRTHLTFNSALCYLAILACVKYKNTKPEAHLFPLAVVNYFFLGKDFLQGKNITNAADMKI